MYGNGLVMLGLYFREKQGVASGLALSGGGIGVFVLPPLLQLLLDTYGLQGSLVIIGGLYFNTIACGMLFRPLSRYKDADLTSSSEKDKLMLDERKEMVQNRSDEDKGTATDESKVNNHRYRTSMGVDTGSLRQEAEHDENCRDDMFENMKSDSEMETIPKMSDDSSEKHTTKTWSKTFKEFLISILDIRVLKSYTVAIFVLVDCLVFCGSFNFALFMPAAAFTRGIDKYQKAWLVSINGLCDIVGRLTMGVISDLNILKKYQLMALAAFFCGIAVFCFSFGKQFWTLSIFSALYGFCNGGNVALLVPTVVELFGSNGLARILAILMFCHGLGVAVGQPTQGAIRDATGSYVAVGIINAGAILLGSILLFLYPVCRRIEARRHGTGKSAGSQEEDMQDIA